MPAACLLVNVSAKLAAKTVYIWHLSHMIHNSYTIGTSALSDIYALAKISSTYQNNITELICIKIVIFLLKKLLKIVPHSQSQDA